MAGDYDIFISSLNHAMLYEVGKFWNPNDPEVQAGLISTKDQRRKVGYVNNPADRGGETKFGLAQKFNQGTVIRNVTWKDATAIYYNDFWLKGSNDKIFSPLCIMHFDGCINHGVSKAIKILQQAVGAVVDGSIGNQTFSAIRSLPPKTIINSISEIRSNFYRSIVKNDPSQAQFLNGWLTRISEVTSFTLSKI